MISQTTIEKLEKEAFRGPILTVVAFLFVLAGLAVIGLAFYFWLDLSEIIGDIYSVSLDPVAYVAPTDPTAPQQVTLASRTEWLGLLPYQGLALVLAGVALLLWRWVAAVRLRMTVSALILPSLRSRDNLDPTANDISTFEAPLDPSREAES